MAGEQRPRRRRTAKPLTSAQWAALLERSSRAAVAKWRATHGDRHDPRGLELVYRIGLRHSPLVAAVAAWKGGNPSGLIVAVQICMREKRPLPDPIGTAVLTILEEALRSVPVGSGRGRLSDYGAVRQTDLDHLSRWAELRAVRAKGLRGDPALEGARAALAQRGIHVGTRAIKDSFEKVERSRKMARKHGLGVGRFYPFL